MVDQQVSPTSVREDFRTLNARLNIAAPDGSIQFDADRQAVREYFLQEVNNNTVFFHNLQEKLHFLTREGYYEQEVLDQYSFEFIKSLFKQAYAHKFRFKSFLGAYKYYSAYTLKTFDGERYLERYEDRVSMVALYLAQGNEELARKLVDEIITGRFQPATPTFLNAGKAQRGELVSCFPAGTLVQTADGRKPIESLEEGEEVLTHDGTYQSITQIMARDSSRGLVGIQVAGLQGMLQATPEHPFLVERAEHHKPIPELLGKDGANERFVWVAASQIKTGDYVVSGVSRAQNTLKTLKLLDYVSPADVPSASRGISEFEVDGGLVYKVNKTGKKGVKSYSKQMTPVPAEVTLNYDFGVLLGYYLSEGWVNKSSSVSGLGRAVGFTFGTHETYFIEDCKALFKSIFQIDATSRASEFDGSTRVTAASVLVAAFFHNLVGSGFDVKRLPRELMEAGEDFKLGVLVGAFRGDGCTTSNAVSVGFSNVELTWQMRELTASLGMEPTFRSFLSSSGTPTATANVTAWPGVAEEFVYQVGKNLERFEGANAFYKTITKRSGGFLLHKVSRVEYTEGENRVYNLEVENNHTYVAGGLVVHNCFLLRTEDNLESISRSITNALQLSKRGGGVALNLSNLREVGAPIKKIENQSSGVVPVMKLLEDSFSYANQLGARQGAGAVYLHAHHPDIIRFLDTKRENADEKTRIKTLSTGVVIPDITMQLIRKNEDMYLFSPYDVEREYGRAFTEVNVTEEYHRMVENPNIRKSKIKARKLLQTIAELQFESGYPYILFEDNANRSNPIDGRITMSNLCSEILQVSKPSQFDERGYFSEIGKDISCNLGSLNVAAAFDSDNFAETIETAIRALTSVSDLSNISSVPSIEKGNDQSHAIGLGQMNLHGFFGREHIHYDSPEAVDFTNMYFYAVLYQCLRASTKIARETGIVFDGFEKSKYASGEFFSKYIAKDWSKPATDKVARLLSRSSIYIPTQEDWKSLRDEVATYGLYHQNLQAIPPTGSISYINHSTSSIHPIASRIEARKEGRIGKVYFAPPEMTNENIEYFDDAYEIGPEAILNVYQAATEHVDQGLSLTLFYTDQATTGTLIKNYVAAWSKGIKTLYYVRLQRSILKGTEVAGVGAGRRAKPAVPSNPVVADDDDSDECESCML